MKKNLKRVGFIAISLMSSVALFTAPTQAAEQLATQKETKQNSPLTIERIYSSP